MAIIPLLFLYQWHKYQSDGTNIGSGILKIQSNNVLPSRGRILTPEPFLRSATFGRSVVLLIDHAEEGGMGLIINKQLPMFVSDIIEEFRYIGNIPLYKDGPIAIDTLFYLRTLTDIPGAIPINEGLYLSDDFDEVKEYVLQGSKIDRYVRFFLGCSGWGSEQLSTELKENTWLVSKEENVYLMNGGTKDIWRQALEKLDSKCETWSRSPQVPTSN